LVDVSGLGNSNPKLIDEGLGTINGTRSTTILTTYISASFDMVFKGVKGPLLSGPSEAYPEVSFVRSLTDGAFLQMTTDSALSYAIDEARSLTCCYSKLPGLENIPALFS
jgi:hypothetical protein